MVEVDWFVDRGGLCWESEEVVGVVGRLEDIEFGGGSW